MARSTSDEVWVQESGKINSPVLMIMKAARKSSNIYYWGKVDGLDYVVTSTTTFNLNNGASETEVNLVCRLGTDKHTGINNQIYIDKYNYDTKKWSVMTNLLKTRYMDRMAYLVEEYERICYENNADLSNKTWKRCCDTDSEDESQHNNL